jgi:hypothetical protein
MVGDMTTSSIDEHIGAAQSTLWSFPINKNVPNMPAHIIAAAAKGFDLVLVDTNPNMGLLNAYLWWNSDYFFSPCVPDCFTVSALNYLSEKIKAWTKMVNELLPQLQSAAILPCLKQKPPRCLGLSLSYIHNDGKNAIAAKWRQYLLDAAGALSPLSGDKSFLHEFPHGGGGGGASSSLYDTIAALIEGEVAVEPMQKRARKEV